MTVSYLPPIQFTKALIIKLIIIAHSLRTY